VSVHEGPDTHLLILTLFDLPSQQWIIVFMKYHPREKRPISEEQSERNGDNTNYFLYILHENMPRIKLFSKLEGVLEDFALGAH